jgi:DNA polymerase phi
VVSTLGDYLFMSHAGVDAQRQAIHFKNRVLALVDTFVKKQPSSPHVIRLILPLVDLIAGTSSDERQLSDKAKGLLKSRIGKLKEVPTTVDTDLAVKVLEDLHTRARKVHSSNISAILGQLSLYVVRVLLRHQMEKPILQIYRQSLADFVTRKNSPLNIRFFHDFFRLNPASAWHLRSELIELSSKAANAYRRCQVFQLVQTLLSQLPTIIGLSAGTALQQTHISGDKSQEIRDFMLSLRQALFDLTSGACNETVSLNTQQMKDLFKVGLLGIRQTKKLMPSSEDVALVWDPSAWDVLSTKLAISSRFKDSSALRTMCKQMAQTSQLTPLSQPKGAPAEKLANKRKLATTGEDEEPTTSKHSKRKKISKSKL